MAAEALIPRTADPEKLGDVLARSGYFGDARQAAQAAVKVMAGQELGLGPVASMTGIHIIQGKPSLGANLMAALIKRSPLYRYEVEELTDESCSLIFFERDGDEWRRAGTSAFTMEDARKAAVTGKDTWKKFPRNMLFARAISNGVTWYCPDLTAGAPIYTPEELGATVDDQEVEVVDGEIVPAPETPADGIDPGWSLELKGKVREKKLKNGEVRKLLAVAGVPGAEDLADDQLGNAFTFLTPEQAKKVEENL